MDFLLRVIIYKLHMESDKSLLPLALSELALLVGFLAFLIHRYAAKDVPIYVRGFVVAAWLLSFVLLIILPLDVYDDEQENDLSADVYWTTLYWINFVLTW